MLEIIFGLKFDERPYCIKKGQKDISVYGPDGFLEWLESMEGLSCTREDLEFLRLENYRQHLKAFQENQPDVFFSKAIQADAFGTSRRMLEMRDELILAGWDFQVEADCPPRLETFSKIELSLREKANNDDFPLGGIAGKAERIGNLLKHLNPESYPIKSIKIHEPESLIPFHWKRIFKKLGDKFSIEYNYASSAPGNSESDLSCIQTLSSDSAKLERPKVKKDGSLIILKTSRSSQAAEFIAQLLRNNKDFKPLCIVPEKNRQLDISLQNDGSPGMGILSASLARPSLQILKLIPAFLWEPVDPVKVLEFVSLNLKPMESGLGRVAAKAIANKPGLLGEDWNKSVYFYLDQLEKSDGAGSKALHKKAKEDYEFWFDRKRYPVTSKAPKNEILSLFARVEEWAKEEFDQENSNNQSLLVLAEQSRKIKELLLALPETQLSFLELEQIVKTIYEPSPIEFGKEEQGRMPYVYHPGAVESNCEQLLWWNFCEKEPVRFFSKWFNDEFGYLETKGIYLEKPEQENQRRLWLQMNPIKKVQSKLLLVMPESIYGSEVNPHPLFGHIMAAFENAEDLIIDLEKEESLQSLKPFFVLPETKERNLQKLGRPKPILEINGDLGLDKIERASPSSLESLVYYPHQWVFRYRLKLSKSSILSIVDEKTLYGNLAHKVFETILQEDFKNWSALDVENWLNEFMPKLFPREGAVLLMYGKEPEKISFENKIKEAAKYFISLLQNNNWTVAATEASLEGSLNELELKGYADLILEKGQESAILDLKWSGMTFRTNQVKNEEDLQLSMYNHLYHQQKGSLPYCGYFILSRSKVITRNQELFEEVKPLVKDADHLDIQNRIQFKLQGTLDWRKGQLKNGILEIRANSTWKALEDYYFDTNENLMNYLEMKTEDAGFDDYRTLIQLVD
ncbi:MAG: PD-(D/E)XK nuclease family protein [Saprospiraceae bacterium]